MAQELREGDGKSGIARAGKRKWGYDPAQVDAFLERAHALYDSEGMNLTQHDIQNVSFDLRKEINKTRNISKKERTLPTP